MCVCVCVCAFACASKAMPAAELQRHRRTNIDIFCSLTYSIIFVICQIIKNNVPIFNYITMLYYDILCHYLKIFNKICSYSYLIGGCRVMVIL